MNSAQPKKLVNYWEGTNNMKHLITLALVIDLIGITVLAAIFYLLYTCTP
jgi:hypothetical protein